MAAVIADGTCDSGRVSYGARMTEPTVIHIIFDGPPDHEGPRFIEVEDGLGRPINVGEWVQRPDGYWALVLSVG